MHRKELQDDDQWMAKQVYLNVGNFLLGVAAMGLDAVPIEGVDFAILDAEFDLKAQGYTSLVVVPVGHHSVEDFNATLPKSRPAVDDHYRDLILLPGTPGSWAQLRLARGFRSSSLRPLFPPLALRRKYYRR
jgi:hypothetical protein